MIDKISWGIIGCGDVTEVKSGPAFNKAEHSTLYAVMRRDAEKAQNYASRHKVPVWSTNADTLIHDPEINAIYVATPPVYHEEYVIKAVKAGKNVYVEKPMALTESGCRRMTEAAAIFGAKLSVAHYRRAMPFYNKIKDLISTGTIGEVRFVSLKMFLPAQNKVVSNSEENWRLDPSISGGGLFFDLAPHQIDMMLYLFGEVKTVCGLSSVSARSKVADMVSGQILFANNVLFNGSWCFNCTETEKTDVCDIIGSNGKISFPFYGDTCIVTKGSVLKSFQILAPEHIQQPMIEQVVQYFRNERSNPCNGMTGTEVLRIMECFQINQ